MRGALGALLSLDTARLGARIEVARGTEGLSVSIAATDPRDLLGELGEVLKRIEGLAADPQALAAALRSQLGPIAELLDLAGLPLLR